MKKEAPNDLLGSTARWTAAVRALESERANRLFQDPWAAALAGEEGLAWIRARTSDSVVPIVIRTRYFDDFAQHVVRDYHVSQLVILGAGLDTRAFRLTWPAGTRLFELDQAHVLAQKERILNAAEAKPACIRRSIAADLQNPWEETLVGNGFDAQSASLWLVEGLLFYLASDVIREILDSVAGLAAPGSWLGFDIINGVMLTSSLTRGWIEMQASSGAPWIGTMDDPVEFLAERGWQAALTQAGADDANYGRWPYPVIPTTMPDMPHNWFVTARRESIVNGKRDSERIAANGQ